MDAIIQLWGSAEQSRLGRERARLRRGGNRAHPGCRRHFDIDWEHYGFDESGLDELNEFGLRVLQSFLADPGRPPRSGAALRRYLTRWIGPASRIHSWRARWTRFG